MERLKKLLESAGDYAEPWPMIGNIPRHYKRITADELELKRLATLGASNALAYYERPLYFTQSVILGAMLSGDYDTIIAVTPSQYGKSWTLGHAAAILAYTGRHLSVVGATTDTTQIIMQHTRRAAAESDIIHSALSDESRKKIDKLEESVRKDRLGFAAGGYVEALSLGDTYSGIAKNKAVGRGTAYIVDEAALVSTEALQELGRRELSSIDGTKELLVMISNPHKPGAFMDALTQENPDPRTLIIWMDALTAAQEGRWSAEHILNLEFAKHTDTLQRYLLCELPTQGLGMFGTVNVSDDEPTGERLHFLGVDSAYKGKDNLAVAHVSFGSGGVYVHEVASINKSPWIDGVTGDDIARMIERIIRSSGASYTAIDPGQGIYIIEALADHLPVLSVPFGAGASKWRIKDGHYAAMQAANRRAEMHLDLQSLIDSQQITFSTQAWESVKDVVPYIVSERKANGKVQVEPKEKIRAQIGKSPDELDAVLLAIQAGIQYEAPSEPITDLI